MAFGYIRSRHTDFSDVIPESRTLFLGCVGVYFRNVLEIDIYRVQYPQRSTSRPSFHLRLFSDRQEPPRDARPKDTNRTREGRAGLHHPAHARLQREGLLDILPRRRAMLYPVSLDACVRAGVEGAKVQKPDMGSGQRMRKNGNKITGHITDSPL